jgi:hypothetical protein
MNESSDNVPTAENSGQPEAIAFADFLEGIPPSRTKLIADLFEPERHFFNLNTPQLLLHCTSEICNGPRAHRRVGEEPSVYKEEPTKNVFLTYICSNCRTKHKLFSLHISLIGAGPTGTAYKLVSFLHSARLLQRDCLSYSAISANFS